MRPTLSLAVVRAGAEVASQAAQPLNRTSLRKLSLSDQMHLTPAFWLLCDKLWQALALKRVQVQFCEVPLIMFATMIGTLDGLNCKLLCCGDIYKKKIRELGIPVPNSGASLLNTNSRQFWGHNAEDAILMVTLNLTCYTTA